MRTLPFKSRINTAVLCKTVIIVSFFTLASMSNALVCTCRCHGLEIWVMVSRDVVEVCVQVNSWTFPLKVFWVWIEPWPSTSSQMITAVTMTMTTGTLCSLLHRSFAGRERKAWWMTPRYTMRISHPVGNFGACFNITTWIRKGFNHVAWWKTCIVVVAVEWIRQDKVSIKSFQDNTIIWNEW